jgi:hypothetical protein
MGVGLLIVSLSFVGVAFSRSYAPLVVFIITTSIGSAMFIPSSLAFLSLSGKTVPWECTTPLRISVLLLARQLADYFGIYGGPHRLYWLELWLE